MFFGRNLINGVKVAPVCRCFCVVGKCLSTWWVAVCVFQEMESKAFTTWTWWRLLDLRALWIWTIWSCWRSVFTMVSVTESIILCSVYQFKQSQEPFWTLFVVQMYILWYAFLYSKMWYGLRVSTHKEKKRNKLKTKEKPKAKSDAQNKSRFLVSFVISKWPLSSYCSTTHQVTGQAAQK